MAVGSCAPLSGTCLVTMQLQEEIRLLTSRICEVEAVQELQACKLSQLETGACDPPKDDSRHADDLDCAMDQPSGRFPGDSELDERMATAAQTLEGIEVCLSRLQSLFIKDQDEGQPSVPTTSANHEVGGARTAEDHEVGGARTAEDLMNMACQDVLGIMVAMDTSLSQFHNGWALLCEWLGYEASGPALVPLSSTILKEEQQQKGRDESIAAASRISECSSCAVVPAAPPATTPPREHKGKEDRTSGVPRTSDCSPCAASLWQTPLTKQDMEYEFELCAAACTPQDFSDANESPFASEPSIELSSSAGSVRKKQSATSGPILLGGAVAKNHKLDRSATEPDNLRSAGSAPSSKLKWKTDSSGRWMRRTSITRNKSSG